MKALSRRVFLAQLLSVGALRAVQAERVDVSIGIQLWSVNKPILTDPAGTLIKLRKIGYRKVESAGFGKLSAKQFRRILDDSDLACPGAHLDFLSGKLEVIFEDAHALGARYATSSLLRWGSGALLFPEVDPRTRAMTLDDAKRTAELANRVGEKAKQAGLKYVYHNHSFEFIDQGNGAIGYDLLLRETDPNLVEFEIDCGWMKVAGYDPVHYLQKYPSRFPMMHVKDFSPIDATAPMAASVAPVGAELGRGFIDYRPILVAGKAAGLQHYFAEQEGPFTRMDQLEAAQVNYDYLRSASC